MDHPTNDPSTRNGPDEEPSSPPPPPLFQPIAREPSISRRPSIEAPPPERTPYPGTSLHRFGLLGWLFARLFFSRIFFPAEYVERAREAAQHGTVVYIMRLRNTLEFLYFNSAFAGHHLPMARFVNGVRTYFWLPFRLWLKRVFGARRDPVFALRRLTEQGLSSALFLETQDLIPRRDFEGPYLETLIDVQRKQPDRPILLVPLTIFWGSKLIRSTEGGPAELIFDKVLGNQDEPRLLLRLWNVIRHAHRSMAVVCPAIDLRSFLQDRPDNATAAEELQQKLLDEIESERRLRLGPRRSHFVTLRRKILALPEVTAAIRSTADRQGLPIETVRRQALRILRKMQAQSTSAGLRLTSAGVRHVSARLFEGFEVDEAGIQMLQDTAKNGPLLLLPAHRSHFDYLVLSHLLWSRGIVPPHIAAGINLAFFPLGTAFRKAGAFFIRRRFTGDELYGALIRCYTRTLLSEAHTLEVFVEGGRSRTGRILPPKLGLLSVVADLTVRGEIPPVYAVPVSIGYERVLEVHSLTRELTGGKKQPESLAALLRSARVLRTARRYGYVNVQFAPPVDLRQFLADRGYDQPDVAPEVRHRAIRAAGYHAMSAAGDATAVNASMLCAAAILSSRRSGLTTAALRDAIRTIGHAARGYGARFVGETWHGSDLNLERIISRGTEFLSRDMALRVLGTDSDRVYSSTEEARIRLEFYKNQMMHHLTDVSVLAAVLCTHAEHAGASRASDGQLTLEYSRVRSACYFVGNLIRLHFVAHAGEELDGIIERGLVRASDLNLITRTTHTIQTSAEQLTRLAVLAGLIENLLESQRVVCEALTSLRAGPQPRETVEAQILEQMHRRFLTGDIHRFETCQVPLIKLAIDWLCQEKILVQQSHAEEEVALALAPEHSDAHSLVSLARRIQTLDGSGIAPRIVN